MPVTLPALADGICCALFFVYLAWLPLPFGSASDGAQIWLIVPSLVLCAAALVIRFFTPPTRRHSRATKLWLAGGLLFAAVIALQLLPLPPGVLGAIAPGAARIRVGADAIARLAAVTATAPHPFTLDPSDTLLQLLRVLAYLGTFTTALLLVRGGARRFALAMLFVAMATFEAVYAIHESSLQRFAIWGWKNTLMFGRASGTFVNPNHFAHYAAIILPLAGFLSALAWHQASPSSAPLGRRVAALIEKRIVLFTFGALGALSCVTSIIIAQSRGAIFAILGGVALGSALTMSGRKSAARRLLAGLLVVAVLAMGVLLLGQGGIARRLGADQAAGMGGRQVPIRAALRIWTMFPLVGSGANTFENVVLMVEGSGEILYNHAHNDYVEIAATMGAVGLMAGLIPLLGGYALLSRGLRRRDHQSWRRRAFQTAALTSVGIALTHALVDFNFFIPANPSTLAAIAGAAAGASARRRRVAGPVEDRPAEVPSRSDRPRQSPAPPEEPKAVG